MIDWRTMPDTTLHAEVEAGQAEVARRALEQVVTDNLDRVIGDARTDQPETEWAPYDGTLASLYPAGWVTRRDGHRWESLISHNHTMPGDPADPQSWRWWSDLGPIHPEPDTPEPDPSAPRVWAVGTAWAAGEPCTHEGVTYWARQAHTAHAPDWAPPLTPALWATDPEEVT